MNSATALRFGVNYTPRRGWFHSWYDFDPAHAGDDLAQIAGLGDAPPGRPLYGRAVRVVQRRSYVELLRRRAAASTH